ncbi:MAG: GTP-binding protein [Actinobacteria bacterium]|nr:GTP-binding protein [Actinomycetota bacterium]
MTHKSAFVAIVGRPNTGKSTLVNALVGEKVVITSHHPNTTRHAIRGIVTRPGFQLVVVDTPRSSGVRFSRSDISSMMTAIECGTSSKTSAIAASRIRSAI